MNRLLTAISVAVLMAPGLAFAQSASPAPSPMQRPQRMSRPAPDHGRTMIQRMQMMQLHLQMAQLHRQARTQTLAALSSGHRTMLETVIGQLALSDHPDRKAAAAKLDAALSASEKAAILRIHSDTMARARALEDNAHKQMLSSMPADVRAQAEQLHATMRQEMASRPKHTPDAGRLLLGMTHQGRGMMPGMMRMRHGMMGEGMGPGMEGMMGHGMMGPGMAPPDGAMRRRPMAPGPAPTSSPS